MKLFLSGSQQPINTLKLSLLKVPVVNSIVTVLRHRINVVSRLFRKTT